MINFFKETLGVDIVATAKLIIPILLTFLFFRIVISIILRILKRVLNKTNLDKGIISFTLSIVKVILYFILVLIIADMISIPISSLLATFSIVGVAASLAIQDALGNLASGAMILITKPFKVGDYINCGVTEGTISHISFSHTVFTTSDNKIIRVPNSQIINSVVTNYSENTTRRAEWKFKIANRKDEERVRKLIQIIVDSDKRIMKDPAVFFRPTVFDDMGIEFTLRAWVASENYWDVYYDILEEVNHELDKNRIEVPSNRLDVRVISE